MDLGAVRTAIAIALDNKLNIHAYHYEPTAPIAPAAYIKPQPFNPHMAYEDGADAKFVVRFYTQAVNAESGQDELDGYLSPTGAQSAIKAIELDPTLGNVVTSVEVTSSADNYGMLKLADGTSFWSAELIVSAIGN